MNQQIGDCTYCGENATTKDHFIPWTWNHSGKRKGAFKKGNDKNIVPACRECNSTAGNKIFSTIEDKREYIQNRYKKKYKRIIEKFPVWEDREIEELSWRLKSGIRIKSMAKKWIINRINYPYIIYKDNKTRKEELKEILGNYYE